MEYSIKEELGGYFSRKQVKKYTVKKFRRKLPT